MKFTELKTDQRIIRLCLAGLFLGIILVSFFFDPANYSITNCAFKELTGYSCPSCGLTRSFHATANLDILKGMTYHLLGPLFLLGSILLFIKFSIDALLGKTIRLKLSRKTIKTTLLVIVIIWVASWIRTMIIEMM